MLVSSSQPLWVFSQVNHQSTVWSQLENKCCRVDKMCDEKKTKTKLKLLTEKNSPQLSPPFSFSQLIHSRLPILVSFCRFMNLVRLEH